MEVEHDRETDTLTITLRTTRVKESDKVRPGIIADFGCDGDVARFETLEASKHMENPMATDATLDDGVTRQRFVRFRIG